MNLTAGNHAMSLAQAAASDSAPARLARLHPADAVEALNAMAPAMAARNLAAMPFDAALEVLNQAGLDQPARLIEAMPEAKAGPLLGAMSTDRRVAIFRHLSPKLHARMDAFLAPADAVALHVLLAWPRDSAGSIMTTEFVSLPGSMNVPDALARLRAVGRSMETIYAIYVTHPVDGRLDRALSLRDIVVAPEGLRLGEIGSGRPPIVVAPGDDRREVSRLISKYDLLAVPVVDETRKVVGIVTVDDVIDAMVEEDTEDVQKMGGLEALDKPYMETSFFDMLKKRAGWLLVLFLSEMLTASAMQYFQGELERAVVLTMFIPLIMSSGGNSGSQATSLIIRALALHEISLPDWWRIALRELPSGLMLGSILGVVGFVRILVWQKLGIFDYGEHYMLIALTVAAALVGIVTFGSMAGSMLPFVLQKAGFDPASASAPFVATLVDVTGLIIYFSIALAILRGTLL